MARWLSFFAEYNFEVKCKPGKQNALADALSRRPDYAYNYSATLSSSALYFTGSAYVTDDYSVDLLCAFGYDELKDSEIKLSARLRASLHHYFIDHGLLYYCTDVTDPLRIVITHDENLKYCILYEAHDTAMGGHFGRKKTYGMVCQT